MPATARNQPQLQNATIWAATHSSILVRNPKNFGEFIETATPFEQHAEQIQGKRCTCGVESGNWNTALRFTGG
jgi:hypothetical protein